MSARRQRHDAMRRRFHPKPTGWAVPFARITRAIAPAIPAVRRLNKAMRRYYGVHTRYAIRHGYAGQCPFQFHGGERCDLAPRHDGNHVTDPRWYQ